MITGIEKLKGCTKDILQIVSGLEAKYKDIVITSGYRTKEYNEEIGGAKDSQHVLGNAIDIIIKDVSPIKVASFIMYNYKNVKGFGINVYNGMLHIDTRDSKTNVYWVYNKFGKVV